MVFDFFKQRTSEGIEQLSNLSTAISQGNLQSGLADAASYTSQTNAAFASGLARSRNRLLYELESWNGDVLEELEDLLLRADIGMETSEEVIQEVRELREVSTEIIGKDEVRGILRGKLLNALDVAVGGEGKEEAEEGTNKAAIRFSKREKVPTVLFVMGANGMGKTTTIGKLAHRLSTEGSQRVLLAACDTFRAGAVNQLATWADRASVDVYGPNDSQKSPSAVLYGALDKAMGIGSEDDSTYDTVIVDTSGRLSNNDALTEELIKMKRVIQKRLSVENTEDGKAMLNGEVPHEVLLVIDAAQGRMALDSARAWNEALGVTGLVLTKLDGSAKGGSVVAVSRELGLPIKLIGVGEGIDDLRDFEAEKFVDGLLGVGSAGGNASTSSKEGKALEARLKKLRDDRDRQRSAEQKTKKTAVTAANSIPSLVMNDEEEEIETWDDGDVTPITPVASRSGVGGGARNKSKKKKKKKKKGKR